jgi:uncharacterized membrane protein YkvA (DUF1232 family)
MSLTERAALTGRPALPRWRRWLVVATALAYAVLPADLVPDVVPVLGWVDDLAVIGAALAMLVRRP